MKNKYCGTKKCSYCGSDVMLYHEKRLTQEHIFCNKTCFSKWRIEQGFNCECAICGKRIHRKQCLLDKAKQPITCSRKCLGKLREQLYLGEENPNYNNRGDKNPMFIGKDRTHCNYLWEYAPNHPFAIPGAGNRVRKHRLVAEKYLLTEENSIEINGKRYLNPEYDVHHIDRNKFNNDPKNLLVVTRSEHAKIHANEKLRRIFDKE